VIRTLDTDVVIFGGGIAGLWSLGRLLREGYATVLLEARGLGGVQTIASQGIIHGGTKYALAGTLTGSSRAIGNMPAVWRDCLRGRGELDLTRVALLSEHQYLWSTGKLASQMVGFFASRAMRSRVRAVKAGERPETLRDALFDGRVYRLDEPVLDVPSLVADMMRQFGERCLRIDPERGLRFLEGSPPGLELSDPAGGTLRLRARRLVLTAGAGNERLLTALGRAKPAMQRRPLHMLMLRGTLPELYAHCLGAGTHPRVTVTSHSGPENERVWYVGGQIAETGIGRSEREQIAAGRRELGEILPWVNLAAVRWAAFRVDRAEPRQPGGRRPENPFLETRDGVTVVWPTKLAFAPALAADLFRDLRRSGILPKTASAVASPPWPRPPLARPPWEGVREWS
jgi:glycine/D-amino acid oxidase-like deaminating enzyme